MSKLDNILANTSKGFMEILVGFKPGAQLAEISKVLDQIDQAYRDAGFMTGQEWFDRFEKELEGAQYCVVPPKVIPPHFLVVAPSVLEAARLAAEIEEAA